MIYRLRSQELSQCDAQQAFSAIGQNPESLCLSAGSDYEAADRQETGRGEQSISCGNDETKMQRMSPTAPYPCRKCWNSQSQSVLQVSRPCEQPQGMAPPKLPIFFIRLAILVSVVPVAQGLMISNLKQVQARYQYIYQTYELLKLKISYQKFMSTANDSNPLPKQPSPTSGQVQSSSTPPHDTAKFIYDKRLVTFMYPYMVYQLRDRTHPVMENLYMSAKAQSEAQESNTNNVQPHLFSPMFLFEKISNCSTPQVCSQLSVLPDDVVLRSSSPNEFLHLHVVSPTDFVIQSIISHKMNSQIKTSSNSSQDTSKKQTQSAQSDSLSNAPSNQQPDAQSLTLQLLTLNINNFLFYSSQNQTQLTKTPDKLFTRTKVMDMPLGNAVWDCFYNGSAVRFVRMERARAEQQEGRQQAEQQEGKQGRYIEVPAQAKQLTQLKLNTTANPHHSSKLDISNSDDQVQTITTLVFVQYSINQNHDNKPYLVKFFQKQLLLPTSQAPHRPNAQPHSQRTDILSHQDGSYWVTLYHYDRVGLLIRKFSCTMSSIQFVQQQRTQTHVSVSIPTPVLIRHEATATSSTITTPINCHSLPSFSQHLRHNLVASCSAPTPNNTLHCKLVEITQNGTCTELYSSTHPITWQPHSPIEWQLSHNAVAEKELVVRLVVQGEGAGVEDKEGKGWHQLSGEIRAMRYEEVVDTVVLGQPSQGSAYRLVDTNDTQLANTISMDKLAKVEQMALVPSKYLQDRQHYRTWYAIRLLQSKLKNLYAQGWPSEESLTSSCQLVMDQQNTQPNLHTEYQYQRQSRVLGIRMGRYEPTPAPDAPLTAQQYTLISNWSICRIVIDSHRRNLLLSPDTTNSITPVLPTQPIAAPYLVYKCAMVNSTQMPKCQYGEWVLEEEHYLGQGVKAVLYIVNRGQSYHIRVTDIGEAEIDRIAAMMAYLLMLFVGAAVVAAGMLVVRPFCQLICVYMGWGRDEPDYRYPLDCLMLRVKLHRMQRLELIAYHSLQAKPTPGSPPPGQTPAASQTHIGVPSREEQDYTECVFCLDVIKVGEDVISVYCRHTYHRECFEEWVRQEETQLACPMCKRKISAFGRSSYLSAT